MAIMDISLPYDISWELIATSDDMIANHQKRFPHAMWKSSLAVFAHNPDPTTDLPDALLNSNRQITFLKVVCSVTSYVPPCEECPPPPAPVTTIEDYGTNQANLDAWQKKCKVINDAEHKAYACSGALVQVAIYPKDQKNETYDPSKLAYFASFEPKKRELIEVGTESGESITQSKSDLNVRKGTTATNSTDNYDVLTGVNVGGGFAGASASVGVSGQWGTIKKSGSESVNVTNSDSSRELREGSSHTTNISNLYHLLNSYHLGTNRAIFFVQPRPHTLQQKDQYTFIDGPQQIEGIQEFFLIVSRPDDMALEDYCIDALLYTAHLDDETSAKALNDPKTAETDWIEFSAIAPKLDDGGTSIWNIAGIAKKAEDYLIDQTKNALNIWAGTSLSAGDVPATKHIPATIDGYVTPSFISQPDYLKPTGLLSHDELVIEQFKEAIIPGSNSGWKIDRSRGMGGYDLWEDPNNSSGIPTKNDIAKAPPEAFVDVISSNTPDDLANYLPEYGLRVRAQAWPSTEYTTMYHGRIKAYFIRNDMSTSRRSIDMLVAVRGVSTCSDSPFFSYAPDKAVLIVPDIATENKINPRNVSPWKATADQEKKPNFISLPDPTDNTNQILLSSAKGNAVPSGLDHQVLGAARAKMANMIGLQVQQTMNTSLSCLAEESGGTLVIDRYAFRYSDFFFNNVAAKLINLELMELMPKMSGETSLVHFITTQSFGAEIEEKIPALQLLKMNYKQYLGKQKKENRLQDEKKISFRPIAKYPILTMAGNLLQPHHQKMMKTAGFHTGFDLIGRPIADLVKIMGQPAETVRELRLRVLGIEPPVIQKADTKTSTAKNSTAKKSTAKKTKKHGR